MENVTAKPVRALKAHLALNVRDVARSAEFYRKMLGIEPSKVRAGYAKFDVQNPPLNLTLNQVPFGDSGALSHLGIQVASTEDVLAVREQWHQAGLVTRDEMQTNCCYAIQDKTWVHDPDGNEWEVFVVLEDNLAETSMCCVAEPTGLAEAVASDPQAAASSEPSTSNPGSTSAPCCSTAVGLTSQVKISR
ncbi:MAG TPA: ArsI/CadI family heavy metal resistance metalloenzyme [Blastocatellia bacterium]|jgi:catechol 2,3-dioxygenase-like lactoylglutathione lyase family enzyme|nr:ArsI/CadI family heavy metal resistance metalloenzyme [Blastocatellia bacterium]